MERVPLQEKLALSPAEAAELLGVSKPTVYNLIHVEGFPKLRVGARVVIPRRKLLEWLEAHTGQVIAL